MRHQNIPKVPSYPSALQWMRSLERDRDRAPIAKREPPLIMTQRCRTCHGEWTEEGSYALGYCTRCHTPLSFT